MNYPLLINAALSAIMGIALLWVWQRHRTLTVARYLGWAHLAYVLVALSQGLTLGSTPELRAGGNLLYPMATASYTVLLALGIAPLVGYRLPRRWLALLFLGLVVSSATAAGLGALAWAHVLLALLHIAGGFTCIYAVQKMQGAPESAEPWMGPLLVALGFNLLLLAVLSQERYALHTSLDAMLRVTLGLVLLYASLQRKGQYEVRQLKDWLERLKERMQQGILIVQTGQVVYANPAGLKMFGAMNLQSLTLDMVLHTLPKAEQQTIQQAMNKVQNGDQDELSCEGLRQRNDGKTLWLRYQFFKAEWDGACATQILISDDTKRHQSTQALVLQSLQDELTGLPNRVALLNSLRERCEPQPSPERFVLVLIDIDRFKLFNEAHGHSMGDEVLKAFGLALRIAVDEHHEVMRLGGDEFALVSAPDTDGDTAVALASTVRQLLSNPLRIAGRDMFLDASMGIALYPHSARGAESMLRAANAAMHVAKRTPGTSHKLAEKEFERGSSNALEQEQALRAGIDSAEFHLVYQPKVNAHTGLLTSFEALARWTRPSVGQVSPLEFIAASERTGLISMLGTTLLRQACRQIAAWIDQYGSCVPVAVNVSPLQLLDPGFPALVGQILQACKVDPQWLTLEITESSAVQNLEQTVSQVAQLQSMGVHVAMDDFGTGFSSLNMLRTLRLHTVKIDRSLITPLPSADAVAVVHAICQLAQALQLSVVAEGIETEDQAASARDAGCAELQGFLYAMPLSIEDAAAWLEQSLRLEAATH